jgi:hypothetical protein
VRLQELLVELPSAIYRSEERVGDPADRDLEAVYAITA